MLCQWLGSAHQVATCDLLKSYRQILLKVRSWEKAIILILPEGIFMRYCTYLDLQSLLRSWQSALMAHTLSYKMSRLKIQSKTTDGCSAYGMHHHTTDQLNVSLTEGRPVQQPAVFHQITLDFMLAVPLS